MDKNSAKQPLQEIKSRQTLLTSTSRFGSTYQLDESKKLAGSQYYDWETLAFVIGIASFMASIACWTIEAASIVAMGSALLSIVSLLTIPVLKIKQSSKPPKSPQPNVPLTQAKKGIHRQYSNQVQSTSARIASEHIQSDSPALVTELVSGLVVEDDEEIEPANLDDLDGVCKTSKKPRR